MTNNYIVGHGPAVVKRFLLTEGSGFTMPAKATVLFSEVVVNDDGDEILELWLAVPTHAEEGPGYQAPRAPKTIFSNTTVIEDGYDDDDDDYDDDPQGFRSIMEKQVSEQLENVEESDYYE